MQKEVSAAAAHLLFISMRLGKGLGLLWDKKLHVQPENPLCRNFYPSAHRIRQSNASQRPAHPAKRRRQQSTQRAGDGRPTAAAKQAERSIEKMMISIDRAAALGSRILRRCAEQGNADRHISSTTSAFLGDGSSTGSGTMGYQSIGSFHSESVEVLATIPDKL